MPLINIKLIIRILMLFQSSFVRHLVRSRLYYIDKPILGLTFNSETIITTDRIQLPNFVQYTMKVIMLRIVRIGMDYRQPKLVLPAKKRPVLHHCRF
jgi:hypothetical protein